jgi:hypothetical protein
MAVELNKTFIKGKMNKDLDERLIPDGEYIDAINVTIDTASGSNIGAVSNSLGNALVSNIQTLVEAQGVTYSGSNSKTIGAVTYEADNLIYWLVTSDTFDAIFEYSEVFNFTSIVLLCTNPGSVLNFNKNYPVTGINFIPASKGEGPFLYWTDGLNPPRRINIARSKSYTTDDPRIVEDINVILRPPLYSPKIDLSFNTNIETSNNIQDKFIYFSYRFKYKDNQYSSLSPFSSVAFHASGFAYDYNTGDNKGMLNKYNEVDVTFDTGNEFVEQIQVLYFDTYRLNVYIIDNYNKDDLSLLDDSKYTITFSANKIYTPIESSEVTRLFDNVPLTAKAQEIIGNRLVYGNYVQFRDIVNAEGIKIVPNYGLSLYPEAITTEPKKTFRSDRDYEIGIVYLDEYGRMTTALTSKTNTLYIPSLNSDTANSIKVTLNNDPPFWATNYRFVIKQAQGDYYNIFPRTFVVDGVFRYFLINESDRDKITVGGYIIFKTADGIATHSNKQFKVLELEYKTATSPFTTEGLYFKIKADPVDVFLDEPQSTPTNATGQGRGPKNNANPTCLGDQTVSPVVDRSSDVTFEYSYYANNGDNTLIYPYQNGAPDINIQYAYAGGELSKDYRISIKIVSETEFQVSTAPDSDTGWGSSISIPPSSSSYFLSIALTPTYGDPPDFELYFDDGNYNIGDLYIFNVRCNGIYNPVPITPPYIFSSTVIDGIYSYSGIPSDNDMGNISPDEYGGHAILAYNGPIYPGAVININIVRDYAPTDPSAPVRNQNNTWTSDNYYKNLEEWFWRSGAYQSFKYKDFSDSLVTSANNIIFRRSSTSTPQYSTDPSLSDQTNYIEEDINGTLCMLIRGVGDNYICNRNEIVATLDITQTPTVQLSAETVPLESDVDVFYEMRKTYRIENGNHMVSWYYADFTYGAIWPDVPAEFDNYIVLGPESTTVIEDTDMMHSFNVGEIIYLRTTDTIPPIYGPLNGYYNILHIINDYAIIIDVDVSSVLSGQVIPGNVYYNIQEQNQNIGIGAPLILQLNNVTSDNSDFNAFAFGNGVESYRIYDNYLRPTMKYSPRATSVIEDYKQEEKMASLCYSGIYKGDTSTNRLNSFNLSQANFKNLDKQYGPIQKLYAQDTNLMVLQQDKITSVLYGKNLLVDAVGGGQVASVPEVLGNQIVHPSEYGISNNPESFAKFSNMVFFTDSRRGAVLQMLGDQVIEISANGMRNYFRDELKDSPNTQKLGMYDPYNDTYVLSFTDVRQGLCELSISQDQRYLSWNTDGNSYFMFSIMSNTYWTISLEDSGYGTSWVDILIDSGYGDQDIYAYIDSNDSESLRNVDFVVQYCDGSTETFTLIQYGTELPPPPEEEE